MDAAVIAILCTGAAALLLLGALGHASRGRRRARGSVHADASPAWMAGFVSGGGGDCGPSDGGGGSCDGGGGGS